MRLQGTDGIRASTALAKDLAAGVTPQQAFLEHGVLTETFVELYVYCYCRLVAGGSGGPAVVIGWDPRDTAGHHTGAAVRGIRRSGCTAITIGVAATPSVSMYCVHIGAPAAVVISASHNFKTQNGIKLFKQHGMKLLPEDDLRLSALIMATSYEDIASLPLGCTEDHTQRAAEVFRTFHLSQCNSWLQSPRLEVDGPLVVDPANGALCGVAAEVLRGLVTCEVVEVNGDVASGEVNVDGGVADLEGTSSISRDDVGFRTHRSVQKLLHLRRGVAVVFDADGDRFYALLYSPSTDSVLVVGGDEAAIHMAAHLAPRTPRRGFVYTVESDLEAGIAARTLSYTPSLTGVGDKWLLQKALSQQDSFAVACESSGHSITSGRLLCRDGRRVNFYAGNGLKAAINTLVSVHGKDVADVAAPFPAGFKKTFYVYYTHKARLTKGSAILQQVESLLSVALLGLGEVRRVDFPEEPDMLYMGVYSGGVQRAGVFVRNSGTEDKTGVNVRGQKADAAALLAVGAQLCTVLYTEMKNRAHPMARAELTCMRQLAANAEVDISAHSDVSAERLQKEMLKGNLIQHTPAGGVCLTDFGTKCLRQAGKASL